MDQMQEIHERGLYFFAPLTVIDSAILAYLSDRYKEISEWWRLGSPINGLCQYNFYLSVDGHSHTDCGSLWPRPLGEVRTNLRAFYPIHPSQEDPNAIYHSGPKFTLTPAEEEMLKAQYPVDLQAAAMDAKAAKANYEAAYQSLIEQKKLALYQKQMDWHNEIVSYVLDRLRLDGLRPEEAARELPSPPPAENDKPGNPGLPEQELMRRLARAMWAEEIRQESPWITWGQIARQVGWPHHIKLLQDARNRLKQINKAGNLDQLDEVRQLKENYQKGAAKTPSNRFS